MTAASCSGGKPLFAGRRLVLSCAVVTIRLTTWLSAARNQSPPALPNVLGRPCILHIRKNQCKTSSRTVATRWPWLHSFHSDRTQESLRLGSVQTSVLRLSVPGLQAHKEEVNIGAASAVVMATVSHSAHVLLARIILSWAAPSSQVLRPMRNHVTSTVLVRALLL